MQVNSINSQNFNGNLIIPSKIKSILEKDIINTILKENKDITSVPKIIDKLTSHSSHFNIHVRAKEGNMQPINTSDFDVFIENTAHNTQKKVENGTTLAERFINALNEISKSL